MPTKIKKNSHLISRTEKNPSQTPTATVYENVSLKKFVIKTHLISCTSDFDILINNLFRLNLLKNDIAYIAFFFIFFTFCNSIPRLTRIKISLY